ncbi:MAG: hypothetical protein ACTMUB_09165 [cyanobacterium endosymbiont of Rhopalodia musculus]|uniref:hypothetical protein n=1 Tax=cyanobacterium endosymbiont of Epithemia clementina EcSB TaxID=3034674 RepID=UPI0024801BFB|nr:hypothetical protein [cyanobacterium endosymbiont of Epithemia clementina EcSB]WGT68222.1 hypothetical protein P3F56_03945 [cyanobacterium endosymbiont of Epithemia clementina EcSB]
MQEFYGRAANILSINVDSILPKDDFSSQEPGLYYHSGIPQTVIINQQGGIVFDSEVQIAYEAFDDVL